MPPDDGISLLPPSKHLMSRAFLKCVTGIDPRMLAKRYASDVNRELRNMKRRKEVESKMQLIPLAAPPALAPVPVPGPFPGVGAVPTVQNHETVAAPGYMLAAQNMGCLPVKESGDSARKASEDMVCWPSGQATPHGIFACPYPAGSYPYSMPTNAYNWHNSYWPQYQPSYPYHTYFIPPVAPVRQPTDDQKKPSTSNPSSANSEPFPQAAHESEGKAIPEGWYVGIHICRTCRQPRSPGYHRDHPLVPGQEVVPEDCGKCKRRKISGYYTDSSDDKDDGLARKRSGDNSSTGRVSGRVSVKADGKKGKKGEEQVQGDYLPIELKVRRVHKDEYNSALKGGDNDSDRLTNRRNSTQEAVRRGRLEIPGSESDETVITIMKTRSPKLESRGTVKGRLSSQTDSKRKDSQLHSGGTLQSQSYATNYVTENIGDERKSGKSSHRHEVARKVTIEDVTDQSNSEAIRCFDGKKQHSSSSVSPPRQLHPQEEDSSIQLDASILIRGVRHVPKDSIPYSMRQKNHPDQTHRHHHHHYSHHDESRKANREHSGPLNISKFQAPTPSLLGLERLRSSSQHTHGQRHGENPERYRAGMRRDSLPLLRLTALRKVKSHDEYVHEHERRRVSSSNSHSNSHTSSHNEDHSHHRHHHHPRTNYNERHTSQLAVRTYHQQPQLRSHSDIARGRSPAQKPGWQSEMASRYQAGERNSSSGLDQGHQLNRKAKNDIIDIGVKPEHHVHWEDTQSTGDEHSRLGKRNKLVATDDANVSAQADDEDVRISGDEASPPTGRSRSRSRNRSRGSSSSTSRRSLRDVGIDTRLGQEDWNISGSLAREYEGDGHGSPPPRRGQRADGFRSARSGEMDGSAGVAAW